MLEHPLDYESAVHGQAWRDVMRRAEEHQDRTRAIMAEPFARLGDDVVVSDFDWRNPLMAWPGSWLFHETAQDRPLFIVRKSDVGDDPSKEVLVALLLAFTAGERAGRDAGVTEGRAEMAGDIRALIGAAAA